MTTRRTTLACLVLLLLTVGCTVGRPGDHAATQDAAPERLSSPQDPLAVLHDWDRRRAAAWAAGDPHALRRLYVAGSRAGLRDVAMLRQWRSRGLRVSGIEMQTWAGEVVHQTSTRLTLRVIERLRRARAEGEGRGRALPSGGAGVRLVTLWRVDGRWCVAAVASGATSVARGQP